MASSSQNDLAKQLTALRIPGTPLVFTNVYDAATAGIACAHPKTKALTTASFAIAAVEGVDDDDLTLEQNLSGIEKVAKVIAANPGLPLAADNHDG